MNPESTVTIDLRDYCEEKCRVTDVLLHLDKKNYFGGIDEACKRNKEMRDGSSNVREQAEAQLKRLEPLIEQFTCLAAAMIAQSEKEVKSSIFRS